MSADVLRQAAALMRERALNAADGTGASDWFVKDAGDKTFVQSSGGSVCETSAFEAEHIASWHPAVALAVADWLDAEADLHWPKRHDRLSEAHYNAEPEHDYFAGDCDESCYVEAYICNGCGTAECKPEITSRALTVARAYLGESA